MSNNEIALTTDNKEKFGLANLVSNPETYKQAMNLVEIFVGSSFVPQQYKNKADCFVAVQMALARGVDPLFVLQNTQVVHGKPSWSGTAVIGLLNTSNIFEGVLKFEWEKDPATGGIMGCRAVAYDKRGDKLTGTTVTWRMANDEGWVNKAGSKWKTMPEQMFMYRAASFFARTFAPHVLLGLYTIEEVEDMRDVTPPEKLDAVKADLAATYKNVVVEPAKTSKEPVKTEAKPAEGLDPLPF